ncbi:RICIN domain-containing protein [Micromonospora sp. PLK6-60]|uniref:RICIN domain-containing protein n=1 Tax=Micromonospora sp. PLK6-60 TaxID=2873383 RepID=UPI001CA62F2B|nr:RICIN domain-containing protein [Micromonospora sp. PLK6-60]MBY8873733.1 RICIN domain-containing protein [Micromonospora sp. PLK6-60]
MNRPFAMPRGTSRVRRSVQLLGLAALLLVGYLTVASIGPDSRADAAKRSAATAAAGPKTGTRQIRAGNSGLCLTVANTSKKGANGAGIQQRACDPAKKTQKFEIVPLQDEGHPLTYAIRPKWQAGWCWQTNGGEKNNVKIVQRKCDYDYDQIFIIQCGAPADRCWIQTRSALNGKCLNIPGQSKKSGVTVRLYDCKYRHQTNMQFLIA